MDNERVNKIFYSIFEKWLMLDNNDIPLYPILGRSFQLHCQDQNLPSGKLIHQSLKSYAGPVLILEKNLRKGVACLNCKSYWIE